MEKLREMKEKQWTRNEHGGKQLKMQGKQRKTIGKHKEKLARTEKKHAPFLRSTPKFYKVD